MTTTTSTSTSTITSTTPFAAARRHIAAHLTLALLVAALGLPRDTSAQEPETYARSSTGTRLLESAAPGGPSLEVLVEPSVLGGAEVAVAEIELPASGGAPPAPHVHGSIEIFYVLSGTLHHVVEGERHVLTPGMIGIVRPGDRVVHEVGSEEPVRALVIWAPGDEVDRIARFFTERPIG